MPINSICPLPDTEHWDDLHDMGFIQPFVSVALPQLYPLFACVCVCVCVLWSYDETLRIGILAPRRRNSMTFLEFKLASLHF